MKVVFIDGTLYNIVSFC